MHRRRLCRRRSCRRISRAPGRPADGAPIPFFTYWDKEFDGAAAEDGVRIWVLDVDGSDPGATRLVNVQNVAGAPLDRNLCRGFPCIPQPPPGETLSALSYFTMWRAQYRVEPSPVHRLRLP